MRFHALLVAFSCFPALAHAVDFTSTGGTTIPDTGNAATYPMTISVSGLTYPIGNLRVTLNSLSHAAPEDLDILLVGPDGTSIFLMSDRGGASPVSGINVSFDALGAAGIQSMTGNVTTGTYYPTNNGQNDNLPTPAPAYGATELQLDAWRWKSGNGTWSLYIRDDQARGSGSGTLGGWTLTIEPQVQSVNVPGTILINDSTSPPTKASTYPITFAFPGFPGLVTRVYLGFVLSHERPDDVDILLGRGGSGAEAVKVMSDAGGTTQANNVSLYFSDGYTPISDNGPLATANLEARDYSGTGTDNFDGAQAVTGTSFNDFNLNPGAATWSLYVVDDETDKQGSISNLTLTLEGGYNTAPTLADGTNVLTAVNEDTTNPAGDLVAAFASSISDNETGGAPGLAITSAATAIGTWEYDLGRGAGWQPLGAVSATSARLLPADLVTRLRFIPNANQSGNATLTYRAWDRSTGVAGGTANVTAVGGNTAFSSFEETTSIAVLPVNDAPTITLPSPADITINEDGATMFRSVTVADVDSNLANVTVTGASLNPALIDSTGIQIVVGTGATRSYTLTPKANQSGTATITLTASDGSASSSASFLLTVNPVNDAPLVTTINNFSMDEDTMRAVSVTGSDVEDGVNITTPLTPATTNPTLFPPGSIVGNRISPSRVDFVFAPALNEYGSAQVTLGYADSGNTTTSTTFTVTVNPVNDAPTIAPVPDQALDEDGMLDIPITVTDPEDATVTVTAANDNAPLLGSTAVLPGTGNVYTFQARPLAHAHGTAQVTVTASDSADAATGIASLTFTITVRSVNDPPVFGSAPSRATPEDTPITFSIPLVDADHATTELLIMSSSSNPAVLPASGITTSAVAGQLNVTLTPATNASGSTTVTLTAGDGLVTTNTSFELQVTPVDDPPTVAMIPSLQTDEDTPVAVVLDARDPDGDVLVVTASSSNADVVTSGGLAPSTTQLLITPAPHAFGTTRITVTVSDGTSAVSREFELAVNAVNDAPTLSDIEDMAVPVGQASMEVAFSVDDVDNPVDNLVLTATSDNEATVASGDVVLAGSGGSRSLRVTARNDGAATITIIAADGTDNGSTSFLVTAGTGMVGSSSGGAASSSGGGASGGMASSGTSGGGGSSGASSGGAGSSGGVVSSSSGADNSSGNPGDDGDSGGCGCGADRGSGLGVAWLTLGVLALRRRRR